MFLSAIKKAVREKRQAKADCHLQTLRAEKAEAEVIRLQEKLEKRTDFFVEREFRIFDRFFTAREKVPAVTDEIRNKEDEAKWEGEAKDAALSAFLQDKLEFLEHCAHEANMEHWKDAAAETYKQHYNSYIMEFEQRA